MADVDIQRIAKILGDNMENPEITKQVEGEPKKKLTNIGKEGGDEGEEASVDGGEKPSFSPDLSGEVDHTPPENTSKNSQVDTGTAISAVSILKQELGKVGCQLSDYQIKFNLNGIDINKVKVTTDNIDELRASIPEIEGDDKHKFASKVSSLAMRAIQDSLNERVQSELGLSTASFEYDDGDQAALSMSVPGEDEGPDEIAGMMEPELGDMDPGMEDPMAAEPMPMEPEVPAPAEPGLEGLPAAEPAMPGAAPEAMPAGPPPAAPPMPM